MGQGTEAGQSVFWFHVAPAQGVSGGELERALLDLSATFALAARPTLDPTLFSHRIMLRADGTYAWEIAFDGADLSAGSDDGEEGLGEAVVAEVRSALAAKGEVLSSSAYADLTLPAPGLGFGRDESAPASFAVGDALPAWVDYAAGADAATAGGEIDAAVLAEVAQSRAAVPVEPELVPHGAGHYYTGAKDPSHRAYLSAYFDRRIAQASAADRRKILAFRAFQLREGSTAAINTYDNQILTWGTGWSGLSLLGNVMGRATQNETLRDRLGHAGLRHRGKNVYDVVDLDTKRVVTGGRNALEIIRRSQPLLNLLIFVARDPSTRDAATAAQLDTFMGSSAYISGSDAIATQALFNLIAHLKHWASGYVMGYMEWALPQAGEGPPSEDRDRKLANLAIRYFYGKARKSKWLPDWRQFQLYFRHMKEDGLDCMDDPLIRAPAPPSDDPFGAAPPAGANPGATKPATPLLRNAPLSRQPDLESAAAGKSVLRKGAKGAGVKALQQALLGLGVDVPGGADGVFGQGLERAVKAFQQQQGLGADGVVGRATLEAIDKRLGAVSK